MNIRHEDVNTTQTDKLPRHDIRRRKLRGRTEWGNKKWKMGAKMKKKKKGERFDERSIPVRNEGCEKRLQMGLGDLFEFSPSTSYASFLCVAHTIVNCKAERRMEGEGRKKDGVKTNTREFQMDDLEREKKDGRRKKGKGTTNEIEEWKIVLSEVLCAQFLLACLRNDEEGEPKTGWTERTFYYSMYSV